MRLFPLNRAAISALLFAVVTHSAVAQSIAIDKVLAIVDNDTITLSEYQSRHRQELFENSNLAPFNGTVQTEVLELIIDERIQENQAKRRGLSVSQKELDCAVEFVAKQNNLTVEQLVTQLESVNYTYEEFSNSLKRQQLFRKLADVVANSRVVISDQEIADYINSHTELQNRDESFEVSHLFVDTSNKSAEQIEAEIENLGFIRSAIVEGRGFSEAVRDFGDGDKENGGYLGWRRNDELPDLFLDSLRNLQPGSNEISPVLQSNGGLHILKLHSRQGSGQLVRQQLIQHILIQPDDLSSTQDAENKANDLYQQLQQGESFEKLARLHSQDAQSRKDGGSLGWVGPGTTLPRFETAATGLPLNTVSKPVKTRYGFHLIKVLNRREADQASEQAKDKARQSIFQRKAADLYNRWFRNLKEQAFIEYVGMDL